MRYSTTVSRCTRFLSAVLVATICAVVAPGTSIPKVNATPVGQVDSFATFDGGQYFTASDHSTFDITGDMTFSAWVRPTSSCSTTECVIGTKEYSYIFGIRNGKYDWAASTSTSGSWTWRGTSATPILNQWQHVAFSLSRSTNTMRFYFNGVLAYSITDATHVPSLGPNNGENFVVGARAWSSFSSRFYGAIDEVRLYNIARTTESAVQGDMNNWGPANASGLVAYYDFNEGSGSTLTNDVTGSSTSTNLSLSGSISWSDVKTTRTVGTSTYVAFPRSYLTSAGTFSLPSTVSRFDYLTVAGGGGGGSRHGGGGGAGGLLTATNVSIIASDTLKVVVGGGGQGDNTPNAQFATNGSNSVLSVNGSAIANAIGGGRGGGWSQSPSTGGSGGGGNNVGVFSTGTAGQGNSGGEGANSGRCVGTAGWCGGGGGGAGGAGENADANGTTNRAGNGGVGLASSILSPAAASALSVGHVMGSSVFFAGGGGGGIDNGGTAGVGGNGGGGGGSSGGSGIATTGTVSTGGGGGGGGYTDNANSPAGAGGSGVVVLRYYNAVATPSVNRALTFAGTTSSYINVPDSNALDLTTDFTIETWIYPTSVDNETFLMKENAYGFRIGAGTLYFAYSGNWTWVSTGLTVSANTWTHLSFSKSGTLLTTYKNGGTQAGGSQSTATATNASATLTLLAIGTRPGEPLQTFDGALDEVRIWDYARDANQVAATYNKKVAGNVAYWSLDEEAVGTAHNATASTGPALNGTVTNATTSTSTVAPLSLPFSGSEVNGILPGHQHLSNGNVTFEVTTQPTRGRVSVNATTGEFTYTANSGQKNTSDSFTYITNASQWPSATSTVSINIPEFPLASALSFSESTNATATLGTASNLGFGTNQATVYTNGETISATVTTTNGTVAATASGSATLSGSGTSSFTVYGSQTDVNATLNSATITASSARPTRVTLDIAMRGVDQTISSRTYKYNSNGHFYTLITSGASTQPAAVTTAAGMTLGGRPGYLATILHSGENATVQSVLSGTWAWIGGTDSAAEGTWRWGGNDFTVSMWTGVANGAVVRGRYTNWSANEPNDSSSNEDWMEIGTDGKWNDCGSACSRSHAVVEFDPVQTRTVKEVDFVRASAVTPTANIAKSLGYGTSFIDTATWNKGETVIATLTASSGVINITTTNLTVTSGASGTSTITVEGTVANINTALNTATTTQTSAGNSTVTVRTAVKCVTAGSYKCNPANGHFYFAAGSSNNATAVSNANSAVFAGTSGFLATVTDGVENTFIRNNVTSSLAWFGMSDSTSEGQMMFASPDAYRIVSQGELPLGASYVPWGSGEPNTSGNFGVMNFGTAAAGWDDSGDTTMVSIQEFAPIATTTTTNITTASAVSITTPTTGLTATNGTPYSLTISATGGTGSLTYSVASGSLPSGLSLNSSTGVISGTTSGVASSSSITIRATDTNTSAATTGTFVISTVLASCATSTSTSGKWTVVQVTSTLCDWTVPTGVTSIDALVVGGGGGGGADGGGGGGGGGFHPIAGVAVTPGEALSVTVGAGGVGATFTPGTASTSGGSSSLQRGATVIATAGGGGGGGLGPGVAAGAGGSAPKGFAGGAGGAGSATIGAGSNGKTGSTSYFTGTYFEYGGGGGGGSYNNGSNSFAIPAGLSGGGNGCGSPTASTNTVGGNGTRGGGGGAGCAGDGGRTNGGRGGDGAVLIRYATDTKDAFPASIGTPAYRYIADDYQTLDSARVRWIDASGNSRHSGAITGAPQVLSRTDSFGASGTVRGVAGNTSDGIQFSTFTPTTTNKYTLFQVSRYWGSNRNRILDGVPSNWLSGFWAGNVGVAFHGSWLTPQTNTGANLNNWQLMTDQNTLFRQNGIVRSNTTSGQAFVNQLAINTGAYSAQGEKSDFVVAEVILYDGELTSTQIRQVENYLARTYNLQGLNFDNVSLGANGVGRLTATRGTSTTGTGDKLTATWTAPSDISGITDYTVEYKKTTESTWSTWAHTPNASMTSAIVTGLDAGTQYDIRVTPVDSGATNRPSTTTSATTWYAPTIAVGTLPSSPVTHSNYTLRATVTGAPTGTTGTVKFFVDGTAITGCETTSVINGEATCSWSTRTAGTYSVTATFSGDSDSLQATSTASSLSVARAACTTSTGTTGRFTYLTITTVGDCVLSTLPSGVESVDVLVVGGGGGGGNNVGHGGGGGGSYYVERVSATNLSELNITVGAGGTGGTNPTDGVSNSLMSGGTGGTSSVTWSASTFSASGGAGGRTYWSNDVCSGSGGRYTTISAGGTGSGTGGTSATGASGGIHGTGSGVAGQAGGAGTSRTITGASVTYGGGGGGGGWGAAGGTGGTGGGGNGGNNIAGTAGTANTGGGGGGGGAGCMNGGAGGSGVVIVRYANVPTISTAPASVTKSAGQSHTFSVAPSATGAVSGDFTYQWRKDGVDISGATSSSYTINSLTLSSAGTYSVVVKSFGSTGAVSSVTSSATLTMNKGDQTITFGSLSDRVYGIADFTISSTNSASLQNTFVSNSTSVCTVASPTFSSGTTSATLRVVGVGTCSITASQAGTTDFNAATSVTQTFAVAAKALTISGMTAANKVYDAAVAATPSFTSASLVGVVAGDTVTINSAGATATFDNKNVGVGKTVTAAGVLLGGTHASRYTLSQPTTTANITAKTLTVTGITANNRVYDGTDSATALLNKGSATLSGVISGDTVTLSTASAAGSFVDKTVGTGKTITITGITIGGGDAGNYSLTQPTATANITAKELTVSGITANNREYDRTTNATNQLILGSAALVGVVSGDTVTLSTASAAGSFATKTVDTGKPVTITGLTISGGDANNYTLTQPSTTASITAKTLTVSGITASNRVYDGTNSATVLLSTGSAALVGKIDGDVVTLSTASATATFATKTVDTNKTVFVDNLTISGGDANNYTLTQPTTTASITAKTLTVSGITANNKVYDASNSATALLIKGSAALVGKVDGDTVTLSTASATATFADKNIGTNKPISIIGLTISGGDAGNYTLTQPSTTASITAKELTVTGITANNKVYNQTTAASLNLGSAAFNGVVAGDTVIISTASAVGEFSSKNVGAGKIVTITGVTKSGNDAGNYTITQPTTTADITAKELTVTGITASNRNYNGTTNATINPSAAAFVGVISGDAVTIDTTSAVGTFDSPSIGTAKTVQISGVTATGTDASNYSITQPTTTADIAAKTLTVTGITSTARTYNGSNSATANLNATNATLVGIENGDVITLETSGISGTYDNKNVGTNKTIAITGLTITGTNAANYTLVQPTITGGRINAKLLTISGITANNKVYDGNDSATELLNKGSAVLSGVVSGDNVTLSTASATAKFADRFVAGNKTVTVAGLTISGGDALNYQLVQPSTTASITKKTLTVSGITANNRTYNGTNNADGELNTTNAALAGVVGSDDVLLDTQFVSATFDDKNVGTNKTITIADLTIYGNDIGNYTLVQPTTTASITPKTLTVSGITANNKVYDGNDSATTLLNKGSAALVGKVNGDDVTLDTASATATFANKNVATNKPVTISGLTISGGDAGNYTLTQPSTTATITKKTLTVSGITANNKVYDATNSATTLLIKGSAALVGKVDGDSVTLSTASATATFADKNVATNKPISIIGLTISGGDAGNYTLTQPSTTASITKKTLTVSGITATTKIYDGNTTASLTTNSATLVGVETNDTVVLETSGATGTFASSSVATGVTVSVSGLTLSGTDANNYELTQPTATADILTASPGLAWTTPSNIVYGTTLSGDQLAATATVAGQFTYSPAAGTRLTVGTHTLSVTFVPTNSAYDTESTTVTITVTAKELTVSGITANNREYDRTTNATNQLVLGSAALVGVVSGDTVTLSTASAAGSFATKTVDTGKPVTITGLTISGGDANNYTLTQPSTTASITAKTLTVSGITASNRVYDGTNSATVLLSTGSAALVGKIDGDVVTLSTASATATFATKTVDTSKTVFVDNLSISGGDANNYTLTQPTTTASITAKTLTVSGITANNKVYDASNSATALLIKGSAALVGKIDGDTVTLSTASATATFADKNIGTNKPISIIGLTISGGDANNYTLTQPSTTATITAKELTVTGITANNKVYDASTSATALLIKGSAALVGVETNDAVTLSTASATATFATKIVETNKTVDIAGLSISGNDANNYTLTQPSTTASITAKTLTVTGITANNKVYDASTSATALLNKGSAALVGVETNDAVTLSTASATATFANANVGENKPITISGLTISGGDASNYTLTQPTTSATITQASAGLAWNNPADITFGTSLSSAQLNATAQVVGNFVYTPNTGTRLNAGTHTLNVTFTPTSGNYAVATTTVSLTVLQKSVTVTAGTELIVYGTSPQSSFLIIGLAGGDVENSVTYTYAGTGATSYSSSTTAPSNAGSYSVTPSALTLSSGLVSNYAISYVASSLTISKAAQEPVVAAPASTNVTYAPAPNKTTVSLFATGGSGEGAVTYTVANGDPCTINGTTLTVDGAGSCSVTATKATSANYLSRASSPVVITINKASQTLTFEAISTKTYGDSAFAVTTSATSGLPVSISASPSGVCDVPTGLTVRIISTGTCTVTATQSGDSNWLPASATAGSSATRSFVINPKVLSVLGSSTTNKTYNASTDATTLVSFGSSTLDGVVSGDNVTLDTSGMTASFATKNIGSAKPITVTGLALAGTHAHRYVVVAPTDLTANITPLAITVGNITVPTRTYNGTNVATLSTSTYSFNGVMNGDSVTLDDSTYNATFADANVAVSAKVVTVTGLRLSGTDATNYTLIQPMLQGFVVKATANIIFGPALSAVYNGNPRPIQTATQPSSLSLNMAYVGTGQTTYPSSPSAPTNAGSYQASATVNDINYEGTGASPWTITKQQISVQISQDSLTQTFNGNARGVQSSTTPSGKNVLLSYQGINGTTYQSSWAPTNAGSYQVTATITEQNFQGTTTGTLSVNKAAQAPLVITSTTSMRYGNTHQLVAIGGSGSGELTFVVLSGPCTVNSTTGVVTASNVGTCVLQATRAESMNYTEVSSASHSLTITQGVQTLSFTSIVPSSPVVSTTYSPTAVATSGLTPAISITAGAGSVCNLAADTVTFVASGLCIMTATQSGDSRWLAATSISQTVEVGKLSQTITFPQPSAVELGSPDFILDASSSSGLALNYLVTQGGAVCSVSSTGIVSPLSVGTCTIEVSQPGNSMFAAASPMTRILTIAASTPTAPHISSVSSGDGTLTVGYMAPHSNGGSALLSYAVTAQSSTAPTVTRTDCSVTTLSCTLIGLVNGANYTVSVAAINARGTGANSDSEEVTIPAPTISAARNVVGTRDNTDLTVKWEDPNTYGAGSFVRYEVSIKKRSDASFGTPVVVQPVQGAVRALSTQVHSTQFTNVDPSQMYETKIVTVTTTTSTETTENKASALVMPLNAPSVPRDLTIESPTGTSARVSWKTPDTDGGNAIHTYVVTSSTGTCTLASSLATSCTINNVQRGASLTVSVQAVNNVGSSLSATTSLTMPTVPGSPSLGVMTAYSTSVAVSWTAPASNGGRPVTSYIVEATEVAQPTQKFQCTTSGLSCVVTKLKSSTQYSFTVSATNSVGTGNPSTAVQFATGRPLFTEWDSYRTTSPLSVSGQLTLPPAPAKVTAQRVSQSRTQVTAIRRVRDADIPVTYALISITTRTNKLLARIKVLVDPQNPTTTVSVPYASSKIKVVVQFANDIGLSPGGPAGINVSEGNTFEWTTVAGSVSLVGDQVPGGLYFARGSSQLTYSAQQILKKMAAIAKKRGGLVYVTGFAQRGEQKSAWTLEALARTRAEAVAKYLSRLGVRQWITFQGTTAKANSGWKPISDRRVVVTTVYPTETSSSVSS